ncbi:hypothetical protein B0H14DRAFT_3534666 [Mycena olivaceomarginata]|nr:hypothetical protein B0H14DRAFT_3534666 [Mycena olivaceomarginata]
MQILLVLQVLAAAAVPAFAQITTFANIGCTGATAVAPCDGSCHSFVGKGAFKVTAGAEHCVTAWADAACTSTLFPNPNQDGECTAIESGNPVLALSCSPDNTCA